MTGRLKGCGKNPETLRSIPAPRDARADAAVRLERPWNRLLVPEGLGRTRFVVEADVLGDDAPEVILTEDEDVIGHLSSEPPAYPFPQAIPAPPFYHRPPHPPPTPPTSPLKP